MSQYSSQLMLDGGRIVAISCYSNTSLLPDFGAIAPAKAALETLVKQLALSLAKLNITVNSILPGLHESKSFSSHPRSKMLLENAKNKTPGNTLINGKDIADLTAFLCSNQSKMIQGQNICVDGGLSLIHPAS